jgi:PAS domain S-box-containing protein
MLRKGRDARKAAELYRNVFARLPFGACVVDGEGKTVDANAAAEALVGVGERELAGKRASEHYDPETPRQFDEAALRRGERAAVERQFRRKDGSALPVLVSYAIAVLDGEEFVVEAYTDLSERKRLDQLKNEFVFVAAHELRNPVTAIKLLLDIIFEDKRLVLDPVLRGYLSKMEEANDRLTQLVDDLLEVSRTEIGRLKIVVSPQNISSLVLEILSELRPSAAAKNVTLRYAPLADAPPVLADPAKLKEILANLVSNAIKYNVDGGRVDVSHALQGDMIVTHVADTGIGIAEEEKPKVFGKFWRSEDHAVRAQAGTGLGLFIVKELVERMRGKVWFASKPGKGTTFSFSLPSQR